VAHIRISELAEQAQVPVSTVRYYERIGLLRPPERLGNGYRVYDEAAAEHLAFIGRAKRMGMPLEYVSELIELWTTGGCRPMQERIRGFLARRLSEVRAQRSDLAAFERQLQGLSARIDAIDRDDAICALDCECVHLEVTDGAADGCARFPAASRDPMGGCSLGIDDQAGRIAEWRGILEEGEVVERNERSLRVIFAVSPETASRLGRLCAAEVGCCSFFAFTVEINADGLQLVVDRTDGGPLGRLFGPVS
jgi:DNA-binding transcriptional MerR regulator